MQELPNVTLVFALENNSVWLGMKKRGFGAGKWNGFGGKVREGESLKKAAVRELYEETNVRGLEKDLVSLGHVEFYFTHKPQFNQRVNLYVLESWEGEFVETDEMRPQRFEKKNVPYNDMWSADKHFVKLVIDNIFVRAEVEYDGDDQKQEVVRIEFFEPEGYCVEL